MGIFGSDSSSDWGDFGLSGVSSAMDLWSGIVGGKEGVKRTEDLQSRLDVNRPSWQVEGLTRAGLNPMLAYSKLDFGSAPFAYATPSNFGGTYASITSARANAAVQAEQVHQVRAGTEKIREETEVVMHQVERAAADAGISKIELFKAKALIDAMAKSSGTYDFSGDISDFFRKSVSDPAVFKALSDIESAKNDAAFYELFNSKELGLAGKVLMGLMTIFKGGSK